MSDYLIDDDTLQILIIVQNKNYIYYTQPIA